MRRWVVVGALAAGGCRSERLSVIVTSDPTKAPTWSELCDWYALAAPDLAEKDLITFEVGEQTFRPCETRAREVSFQIERDRDAGGFPFGFHYLVRDPGRVASGDADASITDDGYGEILIVTEANQIGLTPVLEDCFTPGDDDLDGLVSWWEEPECAYEVSCDRDRTDCRDLLFDTVIQGEGGLYGGNQGIGTWRVDGEVATEGDAFSLGDDWMWTRGLANGPHTVTFDQDYPVPGFGVAVIDVPSDTNRFTVPVLWESTCFDDIDQDGNGLVDCADPACIDLCDVEHCDDGVDDDGDGLADCFDPDCADAPHCLGGEDCTNGADDDCDALVDCADVDDCGTHPTCQPEGVCDDGLDDDGDGDTDCEDNDCSTDPACVDSCGQALVVAGAYTKGGLGALSWNQDFVEIGNRSDTPQSLSQVWLHVMDGLGNWYVFDIDGTVPAHGYYLVQLDGLGQNRPLPTADHVAGPFVPDLSDGGSGVVLSSSANAAPRSMCPTTDVIDRLGLNGGPFCAENFLSPLGTPTDTQGFRRIDTCVDTDDNRVDFAVTAMPDPRNSAVAGTSCGCP